MAVRHHHVAELQSVRGLAALVVLLHHCLFYFAMPEQLHAAAETLLNAHAAVVAFFVLSGYVLTASVGRTALSSIDSARFILRRFFRIYPAVWIACLISLALLAVIDHDVAVPGRSEWASKYFQSADGGAKSALLSFAAYGIYLVPPIWSITVELLGSILVLALAFATRGKPALLAAAIIALAIVSLVLPQTGRGAIAASYMVHFAIGAAIPHVIEPLRDRIGPRAARFIALGCVIVMSAFRLVGGWDFTTAYHAPLPGLVEGISAALLIALVVARREAFGWLSLRPFVALGDVSYSLYLLHFPVMAAVATVGAATLGLAVFLSWPLSALALMAATLAITLPLSTLTYRWVELPGIALGNAALTTLGIQKPRAPTPVPAPAQH